MRLQQLPAECLVSLIRVGLHAASLANLGLED